MYADVCVGGQVRVLEQTGQLSLAYACAITHGLEEEAQRLLPILEASQIPIPDGLPVVGAQLLQVSQGHTRSQAYTDARGIVVH
jgi:hypothetical protein